MHEPKKKKGKKKRKLKKEEKELDSMAIDVPGTRDRRRLTDFLIQTLNSPNLVRGKGSGGHSARGYNAETRLGRTAAHTETLGQPRVISSARVEAKIGRYSFRSCDT